MKVYIVTVTTYGYYDYDTEVHVDKVFSTEKAAMSYIYGKGNDYDIEEAEVVDE